MAEKAVKVVATVQPHEFHPYGRAVVVEQPAKRGKVSHRAPNPEKDALKRRLKDAINTMRRLAAEKDSGADMAAALSRLQAKTFASRLAELAGIADARKGRGVTAADLDRLEQTMAWLDRFVSDEETRRLLLDWARGETWMGLCHVYSGSQPTLWRRIDRALNDILCGLRAECTKGVELMNKIGL